MGALSKSIDELSARVMRFRADSKAHLTHQETAPHGQTLHGEIDCEVEIVSAELRSGLSCKAVQNIASDRTYLSISIAVAAFAPAITVDSPLWTELQLVHHQSFASLGSNDQARDLSLFDGWLGKLIELVKQIVERAEHEETLPQGVQLRPAPFRILQGANLFDLNTQACREFTELPRVRAQVVDHRC